MIRQKTGSNRDSQVPSSLGSKRHLKGLRCVTAVRRTFSSKQCRQYTTHKCIHLWATQPTSSARGTSGAVPLWLLMPYLPPQPVHSICLLAHIHTYAPIQSNPRLWFLLSFSDRSQRSGPGRGVSNSKPTNNESRTPKKGKAQQLSVAIRTTLKSRRDLLLGMLSTQ